MSRREAQLEREYQARLIKKLRAMFPDCIILKNDPNYAQGILDLSIFYGRRWAMLEVKPYANALHQPNQDWYVEKTNNMSFGAFIFPENEEEVLSELQQAFGTKRTSRVSEPKSVSLDSI